MKYNQLTMDSRSQIYALKSTGMNQKEIAAHLNVAASTICRELKRNTGQRGYRQVQANELATQRRYQASAKPKKMTPELIVKIEEKLRQKWSPEQISGVFKASKIFISYAIIYAHIWADKRAGGYLYTNLRHTGKKYNRKGAKTAGRGCIPNRVVVNVLR